MFITDRLLHLLDGSHIVDPTKSGSGGFGAEPIFPELVIAMGLRWLAGGMWQHIKQDMMLAGLHSIAVKTSFLMPFLVVTIWQYDSPRHFFN
jgi:hypothetical protein